MCREEDVFWLAMDGVSMQSLKEGLIGIGGGEYVVRVRGLVLAVETRVRTSEGSRGKEGGSRLAKGGPMACVCEEWWRKVVGSG